MVYSNKTETPSGAASLGESYVSVGETDIRVVMDQNNHGDEQQQKPATERNTYNLERDPSLAGRRKPTNLPFCPHCSQKNVRTMTKTYPNAVTWGAVAVGAVVFFPICWIPLVVDNMKKTDHYCQSCGQKLATIKPLEGVGVKERS
eukprot:CAMPEP_0113637038 /NCGR_PEP_ID=MMETSP0017_2-20120614/19367_1 /TAXON_ID=2856 /ORGANISM="Cylindrotheca closterium" /LENGTH=145 /DNA_ID=CAMNT_0000548007 /DNA_START=41 /DNA_END=478 /DNA_ORIENTATION=- /assembly_acc=CAM_ASM_000147